MLNENYVGKEEDEHIMKVIEEMESEIDYSVGTDFKELFGMDIDTKTYLED